MERLDDTKFAWDDVDKISELGSLR